MAAYLEDSYRRLGGQRIDCLALHGLNTWEHLAWVQQPQGCMAAVRQAQAEGWIGHVGFSSHGSRSLIRGGDLDRAIRVPQSSLLLFFSAPCSPN
jgi:predicted aldo/keto reductase-like oxidoreductase